MPVNTSEINNKPLSLDGKRYPFTIFTRYYGVPQSHGYQGQIQSNINQFISIQFSEQNAIVNIVNSLVDPSLSIKAVGQAANQFQANTSQYQTLS
jgi:hypothetical protein